MPKFKVEIEHFFSAFRDFLKFIDENCVGRFESIALICIYIDSLSGYRYGPHNNKKRYIDFILNYSGLKDIYSKVSLPLLSDQVQNLYHTRKDLIAFFTSELNIVRAENTSGFIYDNSDISDIELKSLLRLRFSGGDVRIIMDLAKHLRYVDIFYEQYRCKVIHEARLSEKEAPNFKYQKGPYYVPVGNVAGKKEVWFGIPFEFMRKTLENCINNFEAECIENDINPFRELDSS